jgi:RsiW-degrading membrane proteinase PrsW (M82 family)
MDQAIADVLIVVAIIAYWVPSITAGIRHVPNTGSVVIINFFLGWTLVGWVVAMSMAVRSIPQPPPQYVVPPGFQPPQFGWPQPQLPIQPQARDDGMPPR